MGRKIISDADRERYNKNRREKRRRLNPPKPKEEIPNGFRKCTKCKETKPETTEYFAKSKDSFQLWCKECRNQYHAENKTEINKKRLQKYYEKHPKEVLLGGMKRCCQCKEIKPATTEYFGKLSKSKDGLKYECRQCKKDYYTANKDNIINKARRYYIDNKAKTLDACKRYRREHQEWYLNYNKSYYIDNKDHIKQRVREYYTSNRKSILPKSKIYSAKWRHSPHGKELKRYYSERRRSAKEKLINTLTIEQWEKCKEYFEYKCAYCGKGAEVLHQEHVIPLSNGGHYTRQNIIPSCQKCNNSKWAHEMEEWYMKQTFYNEARLKKIHKWTETNPKSGIQQVAFF